MPVAPTQSRKTQMTTSLYDLSVPTFLQTLRALAGILDRTVRHCAETGADPDDFVEARLVQDMAPFHFQIESVKNHSVWGMETVKTGVFAPPPMRTSLPLADAFARSMAASMPSVTKWKVVSESVKDGRAWCVSTNTSQ